MTYAYIPGPDQPDEEISIPVGQAIAGGAAAWFLSAAQALALRMRSDKISHQGGTIWHK